jgi:hypothetical protein
MVPLPESLGLDPVPRRPRHCPLIKMSGKVATGRARINSDKVSGSPGQPSLGPSREREDRVLSNAPAGLTSDG